ncbi:cagY like domain protein [Helicobacter pylori]|nr:cagY like domain protein [Helicobacter pylori]
MLLTILVCPIKPLMGRDEILQQTPLKHLKIASNTHAKSLSFTPHYDPLNE